MFCFHYHHMFLGTPNKPEMSIISSSDGISCGVIIKWSHDASSSDCMTLFYTIRYKQQTPYEGDEWTDVNVSASNVNQLKLDMNCSTEYAFQVVAWNMVGESPSSVVQYTTKGLTTQKGGMGFDVRERAVVATPSP